MLSMSLLILETPPPTGIGITGNEAAVAVGTSLLLNCSSDLTILTAEWLYDDEVVAQSIATEALLAIPSVNDSLHNRQYRCRVTTPFGVQERNTTITVTGTYQKSCSH
jgi:hypothetical protein